MESVIESDNGLYSLIHKDPQLHSPIVFGSRAFAEISLQFPTLVA